MNCVECGSTKTQVSNGRPIRGMMRRTRTCKECGHRFYTWEIADEDLSSREKKWKEKAKEKLIEHVKGFDTLLK